MRKPEITKNTNTALQPFQLNAASTRFGTTSASAVSFSGMRNAMWCSTTSRIDSPRNASMPGLRVEGSVITGFGKSVPE
jgi:hypothetical protein